MYQDPAKLLMYWDLSICLSSSTAKPPREDSGRMIARREKKGDE